jgi:glycerol-3-phosphate acyltransferase PlsY
MVGMTMTVWAICVLGAFIAGSIPFGVLIARLQGINIQEHGSKNIGATNVGRVLGKKLGIICFILDVLKGSVPVLVVGSLAGTFGKQLDSIGTYDMVLWIAVVFAALLGHMYPPWLNWKGGKGVATTFGGMVAMWPLLTVPVLMAMGVWIVSLVLSKIVSLASVAAAASLPIMTIGWVYWQTGSLSIAHSWPLIGVTTLIAALVVWKHRSNIQRIALGQEPKLGSGANLTEEQ